MSNIKDPRPENPRSCCILCATWVCHECWDWHRSGANQLSHQVCTNCGGIEGEFVAVRHLRHHHHAGLGRIPRPIPTELPTSMEEIRRLYFCGWI